MQPSEALSTTAQVAVTLAGFAGVVVAFRSGAVHEWDKIDKFRLQILLTNSATPFALSLFAMVLSATTVDSVTVWRLCSIITFVVLVGVGASYGTTFRRFAPQEFRASGGKALIMRAGGLVAIAVTLLQMYNVIRLQSFWPFFVAIATLLLFAMLQFILLVAAGHEPPNNP
jgi:hypothetical protein